MDGTGRLSAELYGGWHMGIFDIIKNAVNNIIDPLLFGDATVYRKAKVANGRGGNTYVATQHTCRALVIEYTDFQRNADGIPSSHRQLLLNVNSLNITFKSDDVIGFVDGTFWRPAVEVGEPSNSILTIQVSTAPAPMVGAVGVGAFVIPNFTFSGTAAAANVGLGEWNLGEFVFLGEGEATEAEDLVAVGSFTYDFEFAATATATLPGTADLVVDEFVFVGAGYQAAIGTADITYDFNFLGSGYGSNIGTADITVGDFTFEGVGVGSLTANASITIGEFTFAGAGVGSLTATASLNVGDFTFSGSGEQPSAFTPPSVASASWSWNGASSSNSSVNKPSGTQEGDLLIAFTWATEPGGVWDFGFSGWTEVAQVEIQTGVHWYHIAYKIAGSSEPSTYSFTTTGKAFPGDGYFITFLARVTGDYDPTTPINDYDGYITNTSNRTLPSMTVAADDSLLVFATDGDSAENPTGLGLNRHINGGGLDVYSKAVDAGSTGTINIPTAASAFSRTWGVIVNPE